MRGGTSLAVWWLRLRLPMQGLWVQSLIEEIRSHKPCSRKNQSINQKQYCSKFNEDFKNGPHQKKNLLKKISVVSPPQAMAAFLLKALDLSPHKTHLHRHTWGFLEPLGQCPGTLPGLQGSLLPRGGIGPLLRDPRSIPVPLVGAVLSAFLNDPPESSHSPEQSSWPPPRGGLSSAQGHILGKGWSQDWNPGLSGPQAQTLPTADVIQARGRGAGVSAQLP